MTHVRANDAERLRPVDYPIRTSDLRVRQLELQVSPGFTKHDAFLLVMGAFGAVLFGAVIAYMQGQFL